MSFGESKHERHEEHEEHLEREELHLLREEVKLLRQILARLPAPPGPTTLSSIKITFGGTMAQGPVTISVGDKKTASVVGFDQNGAVFSGPIPPVSFTLDNSTVATLTVDQPSNTAVVVGAAAGVANLTASLTSAEGLALSDTETVTVTAVVPVLASVKISFA